MSPVLTRDQATGTRHFPILRTITAVFVAFLFVCWLFPALEPPSVVDRISVQNPTAYDVDVEVRRWSTPNDDYDRPWIDIGTVPARGRAELFEVIDQGWAWVFRFSASGHFGGEYAAERDDLRRRQWDVTIPGDVGERLTEAGLSPVRP